MQKAIVIKGVVLIVISIILGAFAAHYLEDKLTINELNSFQVGVRYQMYGGLLLLLLGLNFYNFSFPIHIQSNLLFIGVSIFSLSIYYLSLTDITVLDKFIGPITPIGGFLMILSLVMMLFSLIKHEK